MKPITKIDVEVICAVVVAVATVAMLFLGFFAISDKQLVYIFLRVPESGLTNSDLVISYFATAMRWWLFAFSIAAVAFTIYLVYRRQTAVPAEEVVSILHQDAALKTAIEYLKDHRETSKLCVWGFGLSWARPLYQHLRENKYSHLTVYLFIPSGAALDCGIHYAAELEPLKKRRDANLEEWKGLERTNMLRLKIYLGSVLPNDLGLLIDDGFSLIGTYKFHSPADGSLEFHPQPPEDRLFLQCSNNSVAGKHLIRCLSIRSLCRQFDCVETARG